MADVAEEENKAKDANSLESDVILELKRLDDQMLQAQKDFEKEVQRLRHDFQARQTPLMEQRDQVLWEPKDAEDPSTGTPALKGFWVTALLNHPAFEDDIESHDIPVLEYLRTIEAEDVDREDADKGFRLIFHFAENPYFTNSSLTQEYHLGEPNRYNGDVSVKELKGCQIHWKAGQDVTMGRANKGKKKKSGKEVPQKSFFRDHFRSLKAGDDLPEDVDTQQLCMQLGDDDMEEEELVEALLDNAHDAAVALRTQIIPFAVRWYTGEASPEDEEEDEEEQEEEEDKEKDEEVDAENEDGNSKRMQGKQEKLQQAAQDCKQQ